MTAVKLPASQEVYIADVNGLSTVKGKKVKPVFTKNANNTFDVRIVSFESNIGDANTLIEDFILNNAHGYSGKVSIHTLFQKLMFFNEFENGRLEVSGVVTPEEGKSNGRTDGCTAWYFGDNLLLV